MTLNEATPVPSIKSKEVLVKVHAAAINPVDYKLPTLLPMSGRGVGLDFSGKIVQVGSAVKDLKVGDSVFGIGKSGTLAEYCVAEGAKIARIPATLDFGAAAALPTVGLTSLQALRDNGLVANARLLILGASGGCGLVGVQVNGSVFPRVPQWKGSCVRGPRPTCPPARSPARRPVCLSLTPVRRSGMVCYWSWGGEGLSGDGSGGQEHGRIRRGGLQWRQCRPGAATRSRRGLSSRLAPLPPCPPPPMTCRTCVGHV